MSKLLTSLLSCLFASQVMAWGLPTLPKAREESEPKIPSPYKLCVQPLKDQSEEELFLCAEQEFWHGFSDGRTKVRKNTENVLGDIIKLTKRNPDGVKRGRLLALRGYLRLAMTVENAKLEYILLKIVDRDFVNARKLDPENKVYGSFLDTIVMARAASFGNWKKASEIALTSFEILKEHPINILSLSGTTIGFPMDTGLPQKTIEFLENWTCSEDIVNFCSSNTQHAPYARPGLGYHFAEAYARMGNEEKTLHYLNESTQAPDFQTWPYRGMVEKALADMDSYMAYWKSFKSNESVYNKVYGQQNYACVFCHGR